MTVQNQFYNYQQNPSGMDWDRVPWEGCNAPAVAMRRYLEERWGLVYLGCHGDRPIVGGSSQSTHGFGMAVDMRYQDPGPGLHVCDKEIVPWLIATSKETGLQAIHHYRHSIIWRPPGTSGRPASSDGWKTQTPSGQMGQTWALWLHLEFHPSTVSDGRTIQEKLAGLPGTTPAPPQPVTPPVVINPPPSTAPGGTITVDVQLTTIRRGSTGHDVKRAQAIMKNLFGQDCTIDGNFGPQTEQCVKNVQSFFKLGVDGIIGPNTWTILIELP